jgi:hypothetical protein
MGRAFNKCRGDVVKYDREPEPMSKVNIIIYVVFASIVLNLLAIYGVKLFLAWIVSL